MTVIPPAAARSLAHVTLVVRQYDEAIDFFVGTLGFVLIEDTPLGHGKRWVTVAPSTNGGCSLLLAKAADEHQDQHVGRQTGGRVAFFLHTDDWHRDHRAMSDKDVTFVEGPREEAYGTVGVFLDLYGNRWDLIERRR